MKSQKAWLIGFYIQPLADWLSALIWLVNFFFLFYYFSTKNRLRHTQKVDFNWGQKFLYIILQEESFRTERNWWEAAKSQRWNTNESSKMKKKKLKFIDYITAHTRTKRKHTYTHTTFYINMFLRHVAQEKNIILFSYKNWWLLHTIADDNCWFALVLII
jgi:hypothetical protein